MELKRLTSPDHPLCRRCMEGYAVSFPVHEQREELSQRVILSHPEYHFDCIMEDGELLGCLLYWETASFIYTEHFFILPEKRNSGAGARALDLLGQKGKCVILEIDPPVDEVSIRRRGFYERCGFVSNPYPHIHPPYHKSNRGHDLVVMSRPVLLTQEQYQAFFAYLCDTVMAGT